MRGNKCPLAVSLHLHLQLSSACTWQRALRASQRQSFFVHACTPTCMFMRVGPFFFFYSLFCRYYWVVTLGCDSDERGGCFVAGSCSGHVAKLDVLTLCLTKLDVLTLWQSLTC
jgi:hypothetical protein